MYVGIACEVETREAFAASNTCVKVLQTAETRALKRSTHSVQYKKNKIYAIL